MKELNKEIFSLISERVTEEARRREVHGTFAMLDRFAWDGPQMVYCTAILTTSFTRVGVEGKKDANFLAIVLAKLAMVKVHGKDTGGETSIVGEVPFQGGHVSEDGRFAYAFSGAAQEVDLEIAKVAEAFHKSLQ